MIPIVNGIIQTNDGYAIKNFLIPEKEPIPIGRLDFDSYKNAVQCLSNVLYPESYRPYLLAVENMSPTADTWDNLIFVGHTHGFYDHETHTFKSARQMDMNAANETELAYMEALEATYNSIQTMVQKTSKRHPHTVLPITHTK